MVERSGLRRRSGLVRRRSGLRRRCGLVRRRSGLRRRGLRHRLVPFQPVWHRLGPFGSGASFRLVCRCSGSNAMAGPSNDARIAVAARAATDRPTAVPTNAVFASADAVARCASALLGRPSPVLLPAACCLLPAACRRAARRASGQPRKQKSKRATGRAGKQAINRMMSRALDAMPPFLMIRCSALRGR